MLGEVPPVFFFRVVGGTVGFIIIGLITVCLYLQ